MERPLLAPKECIAVRIKIHVQRARHSIYTVATELSLHQKLV